MPGCVGSSSEQGGEAAADTSSRSSDTLRRHDLDTLATSTVTIGKHVFRVWLAQDFDRERPGVVQEGLMHVPPEEIADDQGMLFVFRDERIRSFWMLNTITPLDIAYARSDGTIVTIRQMPAQTIRSFGSIEPAMFALEVKHGTFERLGIAEGDTMVIPAEVIEMSP
jgi:uncharacterized membrane protein (UPF0127 family)